MLFTIALIAIAILAAAVCIFLYGPDILELIVDKLADWEEIMDSLQDEK